MSAREGLSEEFRLLEKYAEPGKAPPNEASVAHHVVAPTLLALGYARDEILPEETGGPPGRPDFTILPGTAHQWYVELKAWTSGLTDSHANQAINYAHAKGARWILLTNGREWRLYDDHRKGTSADRLVATVGISSQDDWIETLLALSRVSVISNQVGVRLARRALADVMPEILFNPRGAVVKKIQSELSRRLGESLTADDIVAYFQDAFAKTDSVASRVSDAVESLVEESLNEQTVHNVTLKAKGCGYVSGLWNGRTLTVMRGSQGRRTIRASYETKWNRWMSPHLGFAMIEGEYRVLKEDVTFGSPSAAAVFLLGRSANGWETWILADGRKLEALRPKKKADSAE